MRIVKPYGTCGEPGASRGARPVREAVRRNPPVETPAWALRADFHQNFLNLASSLDTMLAEARKYRLSLVLAHQNLAQFPRELLEAASANARNKVFFTCSPRDAKNLAEHTLPELDEHDLAHLDAYTTAARLLVNGRQLPAFTMRTRPARPIVGEATAIRRAAADAVPKQDTSAVDEVVRNVERLRSLNPMVAVK